MEQEALLKGLAAGMPMTVQLWDAGILLSSNYNGTKYSMRHIMLFDISPTFYFLNHTHELKRMGKLAFVFSNCCVYKLCTLEQTSL